MRGKAIVTNSTFSENASPEAAGLFSSGALRLSNSILSGNEGASDCQSSGLWDIASKGNLIRTSDGCEGIASREDPRLGKFGRYNGPTMIYPLNGDSPAINLGENSEAVDHEGHVVALAEQPVLARAHRRGKYGRTKVFAHGKRDQRTVGLSLSLCAERRRSQAQEIRLVHRAPVRYARRVTGDPACEPARPGRANRRAPRRSVPAAGLRDPVRPPAPARCLPGSRG